MRATVTPAGILTFRNDTFRVALGYGGVRTDKHEGDGGTPAGLLPLREILYRADRLPAPVSASPASPGLVSPGLVSPGLVRPVPVRPMTPSDGWCDDPGHASYNRAVQRPFNASAEALWRDDASYDIVGVLGWNDDPPVAGRGSAIFLHLARFDFAPTEGCIALALDDLRRVLAQGLTEILVTG
jgi:L,D-peptidoglycan transpeptidase YkuD (ErfK/YbiS/YcfS/YnhG family)